MKFTISYLVSSATILFLGFVSSSLGLTVSYPELLGGMLLGAINVGLMSLLGRELIRGTRTNRPYLLVAAKLSSLVGLIILGSTITGANLWSGLAGFLTFFPALVLYRFLEER